MLKQEGRDGKFVGVELRVESVKNAGSSDRWSAEVIYERSRKQWRGKPFVDVPVEDVLCDKFKCVAAVDGEMDGTVVGDATVPKRVGRGRVEALEGAYVVDGAANVHPALRVGRAEPIVPIGEEPSERPGCEARHSRQARRNEHRRPEQENATVDPVVASGRT